MGELSVGESSGHGDKMIFRKYSNMRSVAYHTNLDDLSFLGCPVPNPAYLPYDVPSHIGVDLVLVFFYGVMGFALRKPAWPYMERLYAVFSLNENKIKMGRKLWKI